MKAPIKLHWARSKPNFGDWLSPKIVEVVSGRAVEYSTIERCDLVAVGSLLQRVKNRPWSRRLHIWGTGFIQDSKPVRSRHYVHALRGPLSSRMLGQANNVAFGDPGLLADRLLDGEVIKKRHRLTIIPHYKDKGSPVLRQICELNPDARVLDVFADPLELLRDIASSHYVLSSAMHGLIAADALAVPNSRLVFSDMLRGGDFKFCDYYGAFPVSVSPQEISHLSNEDIEALSADYSRPGVEGLKSKLMDAFPDL